jgi:hypothetical protein
LRLPLSIEEARGVPLILDEGKANASQVDGSNGYAAASTLLLGGWTGWNILGGLVLLSAVFPSIL